MDAKQLDDLIHKAVKKIGGQKDNDICHYIPVTTGGYLHHFTLRKMKSEDPKLLASWINQYILQADKPQEVTPKQRAARGSRKRRELFSLSKQDFEKMLYMARQANDKEMIRKLTPKKDLKALKRELISSIKHNRVDQDLWELYAEAHTSHAHQHAHNGTPVLFN